MILYALPAYCCLSNHSRRPLVCILLGAIPGIAGGALACSSETLALTIDVYMVNLGIPTCCGVGGGLLFWMIAYYGERN